MTGAFAVALGVGTPACAQSGYADQYGGEARSSGLGYADQYGGPALRGSDRVFDYADQYDGRRSEAKTPETRGFASSAPLDAPLGALDPMSGLGLGPGYAGSPGAAAVAGAGAAAQSAPLGGAPSVYGAGDWKSGWVDPYAGVAAKASKVGAIESHEAGSIGRAILGGLTPTGRPAGSLGDRDSPANIQDVAQPDQTGAGRGDSDEGRSGQDGSGAKGPDGKPARRPDFADQYIGSRNRDKDAPSFADQFGPRAADTARGPTPTGPTAAPASRELQAKDDQSLTGAVRDLLRNAKAAIRAW